MIKSNPFQGYLKSLGMARTAEVKRDARIGEAEVCSFFIHSPLITLVITIDYRHDVTLLLKKRSRRNREWPPGF